ncbi:MAG: class I SAM-dependent methyltransferase [Polyangiaceae bacterium]|nr:class I SAM-dependent methyltransferase [Polyangiaceae bacterium]
MLFGLAKRMHRLGVQAPRTRRLAPVLADLVGPASSLLDVGAGDGEVARSVAELVGAQRVEGVDVLVQPHGQVPTRSYDGEHLPFEDGAFDVVLLSDVLHHVVSAEGVLCEALRVATRAVVVKDHFAFGPVSRAMLLAMDLSANGFYDIGVLGNYLDPGAWHDLVRRVGGRVEKLVWPLHVHALPLRLVTRSELQFAARIERTPS